MSVYVIVQGKIENRGLLDQYVEKAGATIRSHQGRVIAADEAPEVVEGEMERPRTVIVEFPSMTEFRAWYDSPSDQEILPLRAEGNPRHAHRCKRQAVLIVVARCLTPRWSQRPVQDTPSLGQTSNYEHRSHDSDEG